MVVRTNFQNRIKSRNIDIYGAVHKKLETGTLKTILSLNILVKLIILYKKRNKSVV